MRIIARKTLTDFWNKPEFSDAGQPLKSWFKIASQAVWKSASDVKQQYGNASIVANNRVIFNIGGNKYRLIVAINYDYEVIYIRFIGTHKQYDSIKAESI